VVTMQVYWRQRADERLGDPRPKRWIQEPSVVRDKDGRHPRGPPGSALLLCVVGVHCWEISLGLADPGNVTSFCLFC